MIANVVGGIDSDGTMICFGGRRAGTAPANIAVLFTFSSDGHVYSNQPLSIWTVVEVKKYRKFRSKGHEAWNTDDVQFFNLIEFGIWILELEI